MTTRAVASLILVLLGAMNLVVAATLAAGLIGGLAAAGVLLLAGGILLGYSDQPVTGELLGEEYGELEFKDRSTTRTWAS